MGIQWTGVCSLQALRLFLTTRRIFTIKTSVRHKSEKYNNNNNNNNNNIPLNSHASVAQQTKNWYVPEEIDQANFKTTEHKEGL
jgi:hypothetical protein